MQKPGFTLRSDVAPFKGCVRKGHSSAPCTVTRPEGRRAFVSAVAGFPGDAMLSEAGEVPAKTSSALLNRPRAAHETMCKKMATVVLSGPRRSRLQFSTSAQQRQLQQHQHSIALNAHDPPLVSSTPTSALSSPTLQPASPALSLSSSAVMKKLQRRSPTTPDIDAGTSPKVSAAPSTSTRKCEKLVLESYRDILRRNLWVAGAGVGNATEVCYSYVATVHQESTSFASMSVSEVECGAEMPHDEEPSGTRRRNTSVASSASSQMVSTKGTLKPRRLCHVELTGRIFGVDINKELDVVIGFATGDVLVYSVTKGVMIGRYRPHQYFVSAVGRGGSGSSSRGAPTRRGPIATSGSSLSLHSVASSVSLSSAQNSNAAASSVSSVQPGEAQLQDSTQPPTSATLDGEALFATSKGAKTTGVTCVSWGEEVDSEEEDDEGGDDSDSSCSETSFDSSVFSEAEEMQKKTRYSIIVGTELGLMYELRGLEVLQALLGEFVTATGVAASGTSLAVPNTVLSPSSSSTSSSSGTPKSGRSTGIRGFFARNARRGINTPAVPGLSRPLPPLHETDYLAGSFLRVINVAKFTKGGEKDPESLSAARHMFAVPDSHEPVTCSTTVSIGRRKVKGVMTHKKSLVAVGSAEGTAYVMLRSTVAGVARIRCVLGVQNRFGAVLCTALSSCGRYLAVGGEDDTIALYCLTRPPVRLAYLLGPENWVPSLEIHYSVSSRKLTVTASSLDGRMYIWCLDTESLAEAHPVCATTPKTPMTRSGFVFDGNGAEGCEGLEAGLTPLYNSANVFLATEDRAAGGGGGAGTPEVDPVAVVERMHDTAPLRGVSVLPHGLLTSVCARGVVQLWEVQGFR